MGAGQVVVGAKGSIAIAAHQMIPQDIVHGLVIPSPHCAKIGETARGTIRAAVTGLSRIVRQENEGSLDRHGSAGHGEGIPSASLGRRPDFIPTAVGDGQRIQHLSLIHI